LSVSGLSSALLIGKNGSGKTSVGLALEILQKIARGTNRVNDLVEPKNFARERKNVPMRSEIEIKLEANIYVYSIALELPKAAKELRVREETVKVYTREVGRTYGQIDLELLALPIIQREPTNDPVFLLRQWLARMLILRPMPSLIIGDSNEETLEPNTQVTNFGAWFSGLLAYAPSAYTEIDN
jgi:hypothetical protein